MYDQEYVLGRSNIPPNGYIRTADPVTEQVWTNRPRPKYMRQYGIERLNKRVLYQDQIWIDMHGRVWAINSSQDNALADEHLDAIITWLEYGREWLATERGVSVLNSVLYRALIKEREARRVKELSIEDKDLIGTVLSLRSYIKNDRGPAAGDYTRTMKWLKAHGYALVRTRNAN